MRTRVPQGVERKKNICSLGMQGEEKVEEKDVGGALGVASDVRPFKGKWGESKSTTANLMLRPLVNLKAPVRQSVFILLFFSCSFPFISLFFAYPLKLGIV